MKPVINLLNEDKVVYAPLGINDQLVLAKLNWIQEIKSPYFLCGITYCDEYPMDQGSNVFAAELDREEGLKLICRPEEIEDQVS